MGSRRAYPTAELYEERERDFYGSSRRSQRDYEELDSEIRRPRSEYGVRRPGPQPDFLREDYGRTAAGPLVVSDRRPVREDDWSPPPPKPRKEIERDELVIRDRKSDRPPPSRSSHVDRDEIIYRRGDAPPPRPRPSEREELVFRHEERSPPRPKPREREREREREEIIFRHEERERSPPPPRQKPREVEREEIVFRRGEGARARPPPSEADREEIRIRRNEGPPPGHRPREVEREEISIRRTESEGPHRHRSHSRHGDLIAREKEEFVIRRRPPPPPSPPQETTQQEIIIRRTERSPSPVSEPSPPPPPPQPEPIVRPPIVQEIITHHRHIDHGVERARSPTPPPPPPSPPRDETLEISIRNRRGENGKYEEDKITFERDVRERKAPADDFQTSRHRSASVPRMKHADDWDGEGESDYYNRKAMERAYMGEAHNGATKDWAIVDVPPGTNRVRMEGIGGGAQEVTWQRYNGVRRSKFISDDREYATDWGAPAPAPAPAPLPAPPKPKTADMWTEITKDLVLKEAIDSMGYDYEETDFFFYVMDYLRYEDVLQLVEISDDIRRERRHRIREIEFERKRLEAPPPKKEYDYYEREIIYERERDDRRGRYR